MAVNPAKGVENLPRQRASGVYLSLTMWRRLAEEAGEPRCAGVRVGVLRVEVAEAIALRVARCRVPAAAAVGVASASRWAAVDDRADERQGAIGTGTGLVLDGLSAQCRQQGDDLVFPGRRRIHGLR